MKESLQGYDPMNVEQPTSNIEWWMRFSVDLFCFNGKIVIVFVIPAKVGIQSFSGCRIKSGMTKPRLTVPPS